MTSRPIEYADLNELRARVIDTNGCDHQAVAEVRRRELAANLRGGAGRNPRELLRELELRRHPDGTPRDRLIQTYAMCRHTRDPHTAMLALWAMRLDGGW